MRVIYDIGKLPKAYKNGVVAIGVFDGFHLGHQKLVHKVVERAAQLKAPSLVLTFSPHPVKVLRPDKYLPYIIPLSFRLNLLKSANLSACVVLKFTRRLAQLTPEYFVKKYLVENISAQEIMIGKEFCFGRDRRGTAEFLQNETQKYGIRTHLIAPLTRQRLKVGSTGIRSLIAQGKLRLAEKYLGRPVTVIGTVVHGDRRGKELGFPTANLEIKDEVTPPVGVYACYVVINKKRYAAMVNIGTRPTFGRGAAANIEVHIFDFHRNMYGQEMEIEFVRHIRKERIFPSQEKLIKQLQQDEKRCRQLLLK